jgi:hypothetical protein
MVNYRILITQAWKIIWHSPYIWVISLAMSLSSIMYGPLVTANTNNIARFCIVFSFAFLFMVGLSFFGLIGLIMIIHRLYRNEPVDFHHLLSAGQAIFKRMVRTLLAYIMIGLIFFSFCTCLYVIGAVFYIMTTGLIPNGLPISLGPELLPIMILAKLLFRVVWIFFGVALCGMVIRDLGIWEGLWDGLTFISKHFSVFLFIFLVSGAIDTLSIIIPYGIISAIQPGAPIINTNYSPSQSLFNQWCYFKD